MNTFSHKLVKFAGAALAAITAISATANAQQYSTNLYRIPYADGTVVKITRDHLTHWSGDTLTTRIDMIGTGGGDYRIVAAADGTIRMIEDGFDKRISDCSADGVTNDNNYVWIEHANGEWTKYSHMKKNSTTGRGVNQAGLRVGDTVKAGDFLGIESDVGCAGGDHLHFEVARIASTSEIQTEGGYVNNSKNRIPRMCGVRSQVFKDEARYVAVGFGIPVYTDRSFKTSALWFNGNVQNHPDIHKWKFGDKISSVMDACPTKLYAVFYEHKNFGGRAFYYDGKRKWNLDRYGFEDNISSLKVFKSPRTGASIFKHQGYLGKSHFTTKSIPDLGAYGLNNQISSVRLYGNAKLTLYEGKNYTGKRRTITKSEDRLVAISKDDNVSSIKFGTVPLTALRAKLGFSVKERTVCTKQITITTEIITDRAGPITYRRERQGGQPSGWITMNAKWDGTRFVARKLDKQWVNAIDQMRRIKVKNSSVASTWTHFKVTCPRFRITNVTYSFEAAPGYLCPREIKVRETYIANGPGRFKRRRERKGGPPSAWIETDVKLVGTVYRAVIESKQTVGELFQIRRVVARSLAGKRFRIASNWVPFVVRCLDIKQSAIIFDGQSSGTCKFNTKVKLRVNADMPGNIPYRLDCADGQTRSGSFAIRHTGGSNFIGVDTVNLSVKKTGKQVCALKTNLGAGYKTVTLQGKDFTCKDVLNAAVYIDGPKFGACPAKIPVRVRVNARNSHAVPFNLKCSTGNNWNGMLKIFKTGPNTYIGTMKKTVTPKASGKIVCALRSHLTGTSRVIALRGKDYQCIAGSVTAQPPGVGPTWPGRKTAIQPRCDRGQVRANRCQCPRNWTRKRVAKRHFICTRPDRSARVLRCLGGRQIAKRCVCPRGARIRRLKPNVYRCSCPSGTRVIRGICTRPAR